VVGSPLRGVVDFPWCWWLRRLRGLLLHFPLGFKKNRPIFCAVLGFIPVIHAVRGFYCVWASDVHTAMIWGSTSLTALWGQGVLARKFLDFFPTEVFQSSSPSFLVAHCYRSQCCVHAWGSFIDYHYNRVLELCLVLRLFFAAQACRSVGSPSY
jgi:hypothetical protein